MYTIRAVQKADFVAITQLVQSQEELFLVYPKGQYPWTLEQLEQLYQQRSAFTVMETAQDIVGFANLYNLEPGKQAFIGNVILHASHRGQGLGRQLIAHMMNLAYEQYQVSELKISVFNENTPALLLYASLGFQPYALESVQHPDGHRLALLHMKR